MKKKNVYAFWAWADELMKELGIRSVAELERLAGTGIGTITKRKGAYKLPTVEIAEGMCRALRVSWVELWMQAGFIDRVNEGMLVGLDAEIYQALRSVGDDFKKAVLKTIKTWLILYEELTEGK